jgi:hypothetical protein
MPEPSLVERVQTFVSDNRRAVLLGAAAAVAVGGVAVYAASSSRSQARAQADKKKKRKSQGRADGPLLEERTPKPAAEEEGTSRRHRMRRARWLTAYMQMTSRSRRPKSWL